MYFIVDYIIRVPGFNSGVKLQDSNTNTILNTYFGIVIGFDSIYNNVFGIGITTSEDSVISKTNKYLWEFTQMLEYCGVIGLQYTAKGVIGEKIHLVKRIITAEQDPSDLMHSFIYMITAYNNPSSQFLASYLLAMLVLGGVPQDGIVYVPLSENLLSSIVYRIKDVNLMSSFLAKCMFSGVLDDIVDFKLYKTAKFINHENIWEYFKVV